MPKSDKQERKQGHKLKVQTVIVRTPKPTKREKKIIRAKSLNYRNTLLT